LLVDVLREDAARLEALDHPVAWAMLLEQARQPGEAQRLATKMDQWGKRPEREAIWEAFGVLLRELVKAGRVGAEGLKYGLRLTEKAREMSLAENFDKWKEEWLGGLRSVPPALSRHDRSLPV
jgi:thioesterase domain-containing protein